MVSNASDFNGFISFLKDCKTQIFDTVDRENKTIVEKFSAVGWYFWILNTNELERGFFYDFFIFHFKGHFVRKIWLTAEKSSYTELTIFWHHFKSYINDISNVDELVTVLNEIPTELDPISVELDDDL